MIRNYKGFIIKYEGFTLAVEDYQEGKGDSESAHKGTATYIKIKVSKGRKSSLVAATASFIAVQALKEEQGKKDEEMREMVVNSFFKKIERRIDDDKLILGKNYKYELRGDEFVELKKSRSKK